MEAKSQQLQCKQFNYSMFIVKWSLLFKGELYSKCGCFYSCESKKSHTDLLVSLPKHLLWLTVSEWLLYPSCAQPWLFLRWMRWPLE